MVYTEEELLLEQSTLCNVYRVDPLEQKEEKIWAAKGSRLQNPIQMIREGPSIQRYDCQRALYICCMPPT
jgi:hypothetical protein